MIGGRDKSLFVILYLTKTDFPWLSLLSFPRFTIRSYLLALGPLLIRVPLCQEDGMSHLQDTEDWRITWAGRDFWRSPDQISAQTKANLPQVAEVTFSRILSTPKDGESTASLVNICQCLITSRGKKPSTFDQNFVSLLWLVSVSVTLTPQLTQEKTKNPEPCFECDWDKAAKGC